MLCELGRCYSIEIVWFILRLKLQYDKPLSRSIFNLRRFIEVPEREPEGGTTGEGGGGARGSPAGKRRRKR